MHIQIHALARLEKASDARPWVVNARLERVLTQQHRHAANDGCEADNIGQEKPKARAAKDALVERVMALQLFPARQVSVLLAFCTSSSAIPNNFT